MKTFFARSILSLAILGQSFTASAREIDGTFSSLAELKQTLGQQDLKFVDLSNYPLPERLKAQSLIRFIRVEETQLQRLGGKIENKLGYLITRKGPIAGFFLTGALMSGSAFFLMFGGLKKTSAVVLGTGLVIFGSATIIGYRIEQTPSHNNDLLWDKMTESQLTAEYETRQALIIRNVQELYTLLGVPLN